MFKGTTPSSKFIGRIGLVFVISAMFLTITAAGANAAGFSFMDSVKEFFGFETSVSPAPEPMMMFATDSITGLGSAMTENFDGMGSSATATLPAGFKTGVDWLSGATATTLAYGTTGTGVVTGTSGGGIINWANGVTASSTDRSLGFLTTGSFSSPRSLILRVSNNTGVTITSLNVAFDYEKSRSGTRQFDWTFFHGATSTATISASAGDQSYPADATNTVVSNPPLTTSKSVNLTGLSIPDATDYYLRWTFTGLGGASNGQGIGIDNLSITATAPTPTATNTATPTNTPAGTATNTDTPTPTATSTNTATSTATATLTNTATPTPTQTPVQGPSLVISQLYGGGGANSGSPTYTVDYVEIKNVTQSVQTLNLLKLYYASASGNFASTSSNAYDLPNVSLNPGQYYLVQLGPVGTAGVPLPVTPDTTTGNLAMSGLNGKVALVTGLLPINACGASATPCDATQLTYIVDWVAWGSGGNGTAGNGEGGTSVNSGAALIPAQGGVRKFEGCQDTNDNNADFNVVTAPVPHNFSSTYSACATPTLSVARAGNGGGSVHSSPAGIDCPGTCDASFGMGQPVVLTATPDSSSSFAGWGGDCAGQTGTCTVTMDQARSATATFTAVQRTLTVMRAGTSLGSVTSQPAGIDCGATCSASYDHGTSVTLTAPDLSPDYRFVGWSGDCTGTGTCQVSMTAARSVTATFVQQFALSVSRDGTGSGSVTSAPAGISCGAQCSASFDEGTVVTLTASPDATASFAGWTGEPCAGLPENCDVTMSQARSVTATFNFNDLVISSSGPLPGGTYHDVSFAGGSCLAAVLNGNVVIGGTMRVPACSSLDTNGHVVSGSGSFFLDAGGALYISDPYGITTPFSAVSCPVGADCGSVQTSSRSFSSAADYIYNGATDQIVGNALPSSVRNLSVVSPPSAVTDTRLDGYSPQVVTGTLQITGGSSTAKKEFKGHVTLLKRPTDVCTEIDTYHNVVVDNFGKLTLGCDVTVTGDWTMASGGQLAGDFAVELAGDDQTLTGDTTFFKLRESPTLPSRPHTTRVSGRITVMNDLFLHGDATNPLSISSSGTPGSHWELCALGTRSIDHVSVSDSDATCSGSPVVATNSTNGGGNTNWLFDPHTLSVVKGGSGGGTVTSSPAGIDCGSTCSADFDAGTQVTLTASPDSSSSFAGWGGDCAGQTGTCTVTMDAAKTVFASFPHMHALGVQKTGSGTVTSAPTGIDCGTTCSSSFVEGTMVTLTAAPGSNYQVGDWGGDCLGQAPGTCQLTMDAAKTVTVTFVPLPTPTNTATPTATNTPTNCIAPDNGQNSVDLPAPCRLFGGPMSMINGLPPGEPVIFTVSLDTFTNVVRTPGGPLGGEEDSSSASLNLRYKGWDGTIKGNKITAEARFSHGPRQTTSFTQDFASEISRLQGEIPPGDPDFDLLRVTAGSDFGLPSPGHTTLIRESPTLPRWSVDSFFDITYRIDFVGKPGGHYGGMSGSTTGTIRVYQNSSGPRPPEDCLQNDNGSGTVDMPAPCPYAGWPISVHDGLPPGSSIQADMLFDGLANVVSLPGGPPGGSRKGYEYYQARSDLQAAGLQTNPAYHRAITFPSLQMVVDLAPRTPGDPVQSFDTELVSLQGQLPPGDPDFDLLRITAGSSFGLPSPGHTTLVRESPTLPHRYHVDSFFDITYRIDFVGKPGGPFGGMSGSTTGTIRMAQGLPAVTPSPTATATATNTPTPSVDFCQAQIAAGQAATCQTGSEASPSDNTVTQVTIPAGAAPSSFMLSVSETNSPSSPPGFRACGQLVSIDAGGVTLSSPATLTFQLDASVCNGSSAQAMHIFRDGVQVPDCNGSNDPCVASRSTGPGNDTKIDCYSSHFSDWVVAEAVDPNITGTVTYGNPVTGTNPRGVPNVLISGAGSPALSDTTGAPGTYVLTGFGAGSYTITPSKSGGVNGAITSFDAAKISQFVTGATTFTAAQLAVADVTAFGGVTSFDAALIARYAASLGSPTGNSGTWFFSPASTTHASITSDITGEDYSALLMGDVSGNWGDPSSFRFGFGPERSTAVAATNIAVKPEGDVLIPISVQGAANKGIISYQFDLRYDPAVIQPQANAVDLNGTVSRGFATVVNAIQPGLLRVVVYGPIEIDSNGVLLNLRFKAVGYPGTVSPLTWEGILFNEGDPHATMTDGQVEILN